MESDKQDDLCQRCLAINMQTLFQIDDSQDYMEPTPSLILGQITSDWMNSPCRLCQFFLSMISDNVKRNPDTRFAVYKAKLSLRTKVGPLNDLSSRVGLIIQGTKDTQYHPRGVFVNYSKAPEIPILLDSARVDYESLRKWCKRFQQADSEKVKAMGELPLLVIDCLTRKLEPVNEDCEYFALSYVWGPAPAEELAPDSDGLSIRLPATVEDALTVIRELGFRYLWVDRYCLDRSNMAEFQAQLNKMAGIYRNAIATIVAAAGSDADHGLPGVGNCQRIKQPVVKIGNYTLWSSMSDPRDIVRESVWMSRAWTYQEGVCSSNWIAFTDEQVFYQRSNTDRLHMDRGWRVACEMFPDGGLGSADPKCPMEKMFDALQETPGDLHQHIGRYIMRQLSYQSDILNGMLGIIRRCGNGPYPINHYFGVPILGPLNAYRLVIVRANDRHWTLTEAFLVGLFWNVAGWESEGTGQRRPGFPSWSWTGWLGAYGRPSTPLIQYGLSSGSEIELKVSVFYKGHLIEWERMCYAMDWELYGDYNLLPQELYIEAPTVTISISRVPEQFQGIACHKCTRPDPIKWAVSLSDDECEVYIKVDLVDAVVEAKLAYSAMVPLKAVFLRQTNARQVECSDSRQDNYSRCCALLVQEGEKGATKCGILELTPDNYLLRWKDQAPGGKNRPESEDGFCRECKRAMFCLMEKTENEVVKLI